MNVVTLADVAVSALATLLPSQVAPAQDRLSTNSVSPIIATPTSGADNADANSICRQRLNKLSITLYCKETYLLHGNFVQQKALWIGQQPFSH